MIKFMVARRIILWQVAAIRFCVSNQRAAVGAVDPISDIKSAAEEQKKSFALTTESEFIIGGKSIRREKKRLNWNVPARLR
jgi:hypothetical protein